jgi:putative ABC transport system substrate-binding protein
MKPSFVAMVLAVCMVAAPASPAAAQQIATLPRVGVLSPSSPAVAATFQEPIRLGLADVGYVEGKNIILEWRYAEGQYERFPELVAELIRLKVDVIAVIGAVTARAVAKAGTNIPVVFAMVVDPVTDGIVSSAERPGGNITGITTFDPQQPTKRLQLLMEAIPGLARVAILGDQGVSEAQLKASEAQARTLGLQPQVVRLSGPNPDVEGAFAGMRQMKADAALVLDEPLMLVHRKTIAEVAIKHQIGIMGSPSFAEAGGLINYGTSNAAGLRQMWTIVDKVIKGAKAGELPVQTVVRYDLIVNLKTAGALGVTIPPAILTRADRVIQ